MKTFIPVVLALILVPAMAFGAVIVNDSFADGDRTNTGPLQADWWSSSSASGNSIEIYTGELGMVSGSSGRGVHGTFAPQVLNVGDSLTATITFTTPATVGDNKSSSFKLALADFNDSGLAADIFADSSNPSPLYTSLPAYYVDFDINEDPPEDADLAFREHNTPNATGRFLGTSGEWTSIGSSGPDQGYLFTAHTEYVISLSLTRTGIDAMDLFGSISTGGGIVGTHSESDASGIANNFGVVGLWANSNVFGSTTTHGQAEDNGITITNARIEYIPEPGTAVLLLGGALLGTMLRRRK